MEVMSDSPDRFAIPTDPRIWERHPIYRQFRDRGYAHEVAAESTIAFERTVRRRVQEAENEA